MNKFLLLASIAPAAFACSGDANPAEPDASVPAPDASATDAPTGCDPATALPTQYRPIALVSSGAVTVTTTTGITSGTIDATAGGIANAPDRPYVYLDLATGTRVDLTDIEARTSNAWDIALKRASLRTNSGDSGPGGRTLAVVDAATLADVTSAPTTGFGTDDFATDDCEPQTLPGGEPLSAFGEWYAYDVNTHAVMPKAEVYVIDRGNGTKYALRLVTYYGDTTMQMRGAFYQVEWKAL